MRNIGFIKSKSGYLLLMRIRNIVNYLKPKCKSLGNIKLKLQLPHLLLFVGDINVSIETALRTSHLHLLLKLYNHQDVVINIV